MSGIATKANGGTLTARQQAFVEYYRILRNATDAAIKAGYKPDYARTNVSKLLQNTSIKQELARLEQQDAVRNDLTIDWIIEGLRAEATRDYEESSGASRVKAYELLGKHIGMWREGSDEKSSQLAGLVDALSAARVKRGE